MPGAPRLRIVDGLLELDYPNGRPERFEMTTDLLELVLAEINQYRRIGKAVRVARSDLAAVNGAPAPALPVLEFDAGVVVPSALATDTTGRPAGKRQPAKRSRGNPATTGNPRATGAATRHE